jgi:transcriptional regulator with XRE-family HTH domain
VNDSKLRETVSTNIRSVLEKKGLSVDDIAGDARVSRSQIYEALHGRANMTLDRLGRIAGVLGVEAWRLLAPNVGAGGRRGGQGPGPGHAQGPGAGKKAKR